MGICLVYFITFYLQRNTKKKKKLLIICLYSSFLGLTSVGLFNSFVYVSLQYTQVINASLFNTAIPAAIILSCFIFKIEKTNLYQLLGLLISVLGILVIITKFNLNILLNLDFNIGDIWMIGAVICWGLYSSFKKIKT